MRRSHAIKAVPYRTVWLELARGALPPPLPLVSISCHLMPSNIIHPSISGIWLSQSSLSWHMASTSSMSERPSVLESCQVPIDVSGVWRYPWSIHLHAQTSSFCFFLLNFTSQIRSLRARRFADSPPVVAARFKVSHAPLRPTTATMTIMSCVPLASAFAYNSHIMYSICTT